MQGRYNVNMPIRTSSTAIVSLVFGILCWVALPFIAAIVAVVCGHVARREIRSAAPGTVEGDGLAVAGLILGDLHLFLFVFAMVLIFTGLGGMAFFSHWHWH